MVSDLDTDADAYTGLSTQADGFYDQAGRRLFLSDGSPDPLTPGAYRNQLGPDFCDLSAPESDPANPRYEPPHLRHHHGDTWEIGGKPFDIEDPGPYGNPLWRPDTRTGRHRRGELPDPIPPWETEPQAQAQAQAQARAEAEALELSASGGSVPPWRPHQRTAAPPPEPSDDEGEGHGDQSGSGGPDGLGGRGDPGGLGGQGSPRPPLTPDRPRPAPRDRSRFWSQADTSQPEPTMHHTSQPADHHIAHHTSHRADKQAAHAAGRNTGRQTAHAADHHARHHVNPQRRNDFHHDRNSPPEPAPVIAPAPEPASRPEPFRFDKLREDAWDRFLDKSAELAAAHRTNRGTALERECGWQIALWVRFFRWLLAVLKRPAKAEPPQPNPDPRLATLAIRANRFAGAVNGARRARAETGTREGTGPATAHRTKHEAAQAFGGLAWA